MKIRSIRYNSSNHTASHETLPQIKETLPPNKQTHLPVNIIGTLSSSSLRNLNKNNSRYLLTQQYSNNGDTGNDNQYLNMRVMKVNGIKESSFFRLKSGKVNFKGKSLHDSGMKVGFQKENTYLHLRRKPSSKGLETLSFHQTKEKKQEKIKLRLQKFTQSKRQQVKLHPHNDLSQSTVPIQACEKQQTILRENLTFSADSLEIQLLSLHEQTLEEKLKMDKIREQLIQFGLRIQKQLDSVAIEFGKGMDKLKALLRKQKADKCATLINWKAIIDQKYIQYQEEGQMIQYLQEQVEKVQDCIERNDTNE